ncbi:ATP-binding protein [Stenotrophomonas sp.]|uniref:hybrid sensor histidine kinase/response regulator n=1 Tax=Stenotrophomonas sp. TaxID=69392 RepID=UPI002898119D|nr:ATP-binding protein [Stenotrophomonas sp.]
MPDAAPIRQLARRSLRVHALLIGVIILATIQAGLVLSTTLQLLREEQDKIEFHFRRLSGALQEQERFMRRWRAQDHERVALPGGPPGTVRRPLPASATDAAVPEQAYIPFSVLHDGAAPPASASTLGMRFSGFYGAFWAESRYPSPRCLLVSGDGTAGLLVPLTVDDIDPVRPSTASLQAVLQYIHQVAASVSLQRGDVRWFERRMDDGNTRVLSIAQAPQDINAWGEADGGAMPAIACLLDVSRLDDHRQILGEAIYDQLTLIDPNGRRVHGPRVDGERGAQRRFTGDGLVYRMRTGDGWQAIYQVRWARVLSHPRGPLIGSVIAALLLALGGVLVLRGYRRAVLVPLRANHERLLESEAFSRTVLDAAPIGLCLLRQRDGQVILENALARNWLGEHPDAPGWHGGWRDDAWTDAETQRPATRPYTTPDGRHLLVTVTAARYRGEPVMLCLFIDLTAQHEAELVLQQARVAADQANRAKSLFLATMSHEIRTPLYGVLGTLELLGLTPLDSRQQEYVGTIQRSSSTLMQLISDILDVSKAEAGQLVLEPVAFCPAGLTEEVLRSYAGSATRRRLQLYACIDANVPALVIGDAARIRQVLNNLISNAIKFTDAGRIVVRLRTVDAAGAVPRLSWQVADTGIGIQQEHQARLFEPFYQANPGTDAMRGTGLGLAISAHLVQLMGGELRVVSDSGLGSSFSFDLPLDESPDLAEQRPGFGAHEAVYVRSPSRELADNLCERLRQRGAAAQVYHNESAQNFSAHTPLLDVLLDEPDPGWAGPHVVARTDGGDHPERIDGRWVVSMHNLDAMVDALLMATGGDAPRQVPAAAPQFRRLGLHVLVAEDNPINQMILREQLEQLGCHAVVAGDGDEALGYWAQRRFDAVLTDVNMPHIDGYALTRRLRADGVRVPIIGATANAAPEERERCRIAGMDSCLVKPISLQALYRQLSGVTEPVAATPADLSPVGDVPVDTIVVSGHLRELFLTTMRSDLQGLSAAMESGHANEVRQMLHRLRGALVMVSAQRLVDVAQVIEDRIAAGATVAAWSTAAEAFLIELERALVRLERSPPESTDVP